MFLNPGISADDNRHFFFKAEAQVPEDAQVVPVRGAASASTWYLFLWFCPFLEVSGGAEVLYNPQDNVLHGASSGVTLGSRAQFLEENWPRTLNPVTHLSHKVVLESSESLGAVSHP